MADEPKLTTADKALLKAATGADDVPLVELTPTVLGDIMRSLTERKADVDGRFPKLVEECPYETRLAVAAWVFQAICDHAREGGSYRYLIYERLGFEMDAYAPLYWAGGMDISNEFELPKEEGVKEGEK